MSSIWKIVEPDGTTRLTEFQERKITLGRAEDNDLRFLNDASLSRRHLELEREEHGWYVRDMNSKNGTRLNGVQVHGVQPVLPGDRVSAGRVVLVLERGSMDETPAVSFIADPGGATVLGGQTILTSLDGVLSAEASTGQAQVPFGSAAVSALIRAGRELSVYRPLEELFEIILDLSIRAVDAERGVIMTAEGGELLSRAYHGEGFHISTTIRDRVMQEKASVLIRDVSMDEALRGHHSLTGDNIRGIMAVPLQTDRDVIGLVYLDTAAVDREFRHDDLNLLTVLANVAAIRIEQERLAEVERREQVMARDLSQAAEIQSNLLPSVPPEVEGYDLAGHNVPCHTVGGDYYDFLNYGEDRIGVVLGDVAGKGLPASLLMTSLQARVRILSEKPGKLAEVMSSLDRGVADGCPKNRFVSLVLCLLRSETGEVEYCNAGHNPPLLLRTDGQVELLPSGGTVLGILPEIGYETGAVRLESGDLLVLFSDGVTEAMNTAGEEFGEERLIDTLRAHRGESAAGTVEKVNAALDQWSAGTPQHDDTTLVVVRRT